MSVASEGATRPVTGKLVDYRAEAKGVRRLVVDVDETWHHGPGQVAELSTREGTAGYFAIASGPDERPLTFLARTGSSILSDLDVGARLVLRGPLGRGFEFAIESGTSARHLLLVGAGTAIGALRGALVAALERRRFETLTLLVGVREGGAMCFTDECAEWRRRGVRVVVTTSREHHPLYASGRVQAHLAEVLGDPMSTLVLLAGTDTFEDEVTGRLLELGVPRSRIQRNFRADARDG